MFEYFKRRISRLASKIKIDTYPKYYEEKGYIIREEEDGTRYIVTLDKNNNEIIVRSYND